MLRPIISLTTDFGLRDPYVAEMKAVILDICAGARIVDISHEIEKYDVRMGAFALACAAPYFPQGTFHVAVVDPSVGTERQPIIIQTPKGYYVGPDNGVLALAARNDGDPKSIHKIANPEFILHQISNTFHGRDIFAPAAAHLANGTRPAEFGPKINNTYNTPFAQVTKEREAVVGEVIYTDDFGNIITNLQPKDIRIMRTLPTINIKIKDTLLNLKLCKTYTEVPPHKPLALIGSHNFLEISLNQDSAAKTYKTKTGDRITIQLVKKTDKSKTKRISTKASV
jgi:S-adenosylmethionine hydrolase